MDIASTSYLVLFLVFEAQTRRSSFESFAVVRPGLIGLKLHHIYTPIVESQEMPKKVLWGKAKTWIQPDTTSPFERVRDREFGETAANPLRELSSNSPGYTVSFRFIHSRDTRQCQAASGRCCVVEPTMVA